MPVWGFREPRADPLNMKIATWFNMVQCRISRPILVLCVLSLWLWNKSVESWSAKCSGATSADLKVKAEADRCQNPTAASAHRPPFFWNCESGIHKNERCAVQLVSQWAIHVVQKSCPVVASGCFTATTKANPRYLSVRATQARFSCAFNFQKNIMLPNPCGSVFPNIILNCEDTIELQDVATQIRWWDFYKCQCRKDGVKMGLYLNPHFAEWISGSCLAGWNQTSWWKHGNG